MAAGIYPHYSGSKSPHYKNGQSNTRLHRIWTNIKTRCYNVNSPNYKRYGGRGIAVCFEWRNSFELFYQWAMSNGYSDDLTIDRIDVNGDYEPSNCRWATVAEQQRNKRNTQTYTYKGVTFNQCDVCKLFGVKRTTFQARIKRGLTVEQALKG